MAFLDDMTDKLTAFGKEGINKAREIKDSSKLAMDIRNQEKLVQKLCEEIGHAYYEEHKDDSEPEYGQVLEIRAAIRKIEELKKERDLKKGVVRCPKCGSSIPATSVFCPECGEKIERPEAEKVEGEVVDDPESEEEEEE